MIKTVNMTFRDNEQALREQVAALEKQLSTVHGEGLDLEGQLAKARLDLEATLGAQRRSAPLSPRAIIGATAAFASAVLPLFLYLLILLPPFGIYIPVAFSLLKGLDVLWNFGQAAGAFELARLSKRPTLIRLGAVVYLASAVLSAVHFVLSSSTDSIFFSLHSLSRALAWLLLGIGCFDPVGVPRALGRAAGATTILRAVSPLFYLVPGFSTLPSKLVKLAFGVVDSVGLVLFGILLVLLRRKAPEATPQGTAPA
jgi:hypothetical protein